MPVVYLAHFKWLAIIKSEKPWSSVKITMMLGRSVAIAILHKNVVQAANRRNANNFSIGWQPVLRRHRPIVIHTSRPMKEPTTQGFADFRQSVDLPK